MEEEKKKVNRPVPELPISEESEAMTVATSVMQTKTIGGKVSVASLSQSVAHFQADAPTCPNCGHMAVRNGACYKCLNCGESLGCS